MRYRLRFGATDVAENGATPLSRRPGVVSCVRDGPTLRLIDLSVMRYDYKPFITVGSYKNDVVSDAAPFSGGPVID